ncbi:MAG TPA: SDR family oxidoreductase [Pyrinomonadaceae bacterium]|nr:SDR family oxidoreductase [Pyrinomonadaceae bacterium]
MKATLITGASGGIGEAFARRLASDGHNLVLVARSADKLKALCSELESKHNITAHFVSVDLTGHEADKQLFEETEANAIEVDCLINNAGFGSMGDFAALDPNRELSMIRLNVSCLVALTHRYLQGMRKRRRGTIINVSSAAGFQPIPFMAVYAASKAFVTSFSEALAAENRPYGIKILALCPGSTETNFHENAGMDRALGFKGQESAEQVVETALKAIASGRSKVVSGWTNWLVSSGVNFIPNALITRIMAGSLRDRFQEKQG